MRPLRKSDRSTNDNEGCTNEQATPTFPMNRRGFETNPVLGMRVRWTKSGPTGELGLFVRSLVGLDREAAKGAFDGFLTGTIATANCLGSA